MGIKIRKKILSISMKNKMVKNLLFGLVLIFYLAGCQYAYGANGTIPIGARSAGMGRCSVALHDIWSIQNNQAGMAFTNKIAIGFDYGSQFMIDKMSTKNLAVMVPGKFGVAGVSFNYFGYGLYNEMKIGLAYGRAFGNYLRIGLQLDYLQTTLGDNYGKKSGVTFEVGLQSDVTEHLTIGIWTYNPMMISLNDYANERIPAIYRLGMAYRFSPALMTTLEVEKRSDYQPVVLRGGVEYAIKKRFFMRAGFGTAQEIFSMGFGMRLKSFQFDLAAVMHQTLGFSPEMGLRFHF